MIPEWLQMCGAVIATGAAILFGYRQFSLNRIQIRQAKAEIEAGRKAIMGATLMTLGSSQHRLRIYNKGKAIARNVRLEFPEGEDFLITSDVEEKFPMQTMHPHQSVDLIAVRSLATKSKHVIAIFWDDDCQSDNSVITYPTF